MKAELNRDGSPGRFVMTGSTRHDALPRAAQTLTGRRHLITILPLSQVEVASGRRSFLETMFSEPQALIDTITASARREDYIERVAAGGFPSALSRTYPARRRWFDDYVTASLERDVTELAQIRQRAVLPRLLERLAAQTAQILNLSAVGADVGLPQSTADKYTRLLEAVFLVHRLPAWGTHLRARASRHPKLHVIDSGLAARLLRLSPDKLARRDPTGVEWSALTAPRTAPSSSTA